MSALDESIEYQKKRIEACYAAINAIIFFFVFLVMLFIAPSIARSVIPLMEKPTLTCEKGETICYQSLYDALNYLSKIEIEEGRFEIILTAIPVVLSGVIAGFFLSARGHNTAMVALSKERHQEIQKHQKS